MWSTREKQVYSCISEFIGSLDVVHLILCMLSTYFISYDVFWELFRENAPWNITFAGLGLSGLRSQFTWGSYRELLQPLKKKKQTNKIRHTRQANKRNQRVLLKKYFQQRKEKPFLATWWAVWLTWGWFSLPWPNAIIIQYSSFEWSW